PLFQEQAMAVAMQAGGFTAGEADQLRRAMAAWKRKATQLDELTERLAKRLLSNGYDQAFCERFVRQLHGFSEYGFPESHAASFALIVYVSSWLKRWHPAAFAAALINSQPMGFYAPAQIVEDARRHGVDVRAVDVTWSRVDCTLEGAADGSAPDDRHGGSAIRLGLRLVKGLGRADAERIEAAVVERLERGLGPFESIEALWRTSGAAASALRHLAYANAFRSLGLDRQQALWAVRALDDRLAGAVAEPTLWDWAAGAHGAAHQGGGQPPPWCAAPYSSDGSEGAQPELPEVAPLDRVLHDYASLELSLAAHPLAFLRGELSDLGAITAAELADEERLPDGCPVAVAGIVLNRQRPGTASGIVFMTLEDETGVANLIVRPAIFERFRLAARHATVLLVRGAVERAGSVIHVMAGHLERLDDRLNELSNRSGPIESQSRDFR
ncbi:MAG: OB-fold nucleic acid binding domain-containing protein, partial [Planctomycetota bacterium]